MTFAEYAEVWRAAQVHRPTTQAHTETMLRRHAYPSFGDRPLSSVLPSDVQAWVKRLSVLLRPSTVAVVRGIVSGVFRAAARDRRIVANPCDGTRLAKAERARVELPTTEAVQALADAVAARYRAPVVLAAGSGLRQGECFGLTVGRVDSLRRTLTVDRQLVLVAGREPFLAPPKTSASCRVVPLPQVVVDALAEHLARFPVAEDGYVFTGVEGRPLRRTAFSARVWRPAVRAAALPPETRFHHLRHYYASLLIRHGESVKTVQARLVHATAVETLYTYSHMWPDSDDRTRDAVDSVLGASPSLHEAAT